MRKFFFGDMTNMEIVGEIIGGLGLFALVAVMMLFYVSL